MSGIHGFFVINKPLGMSSQRAVQIVKRWAREKTGERKIKVGHAGTLDPLATGVLIVAVGREYTRMIDEIVGAQKEYEATIFLGTTSTTDDAEGPKTEHAVDQVPTRDDIDRAVRQFIGAIDQIPPAYSAIKIEGQEAYKRMRRGEVVVMEPRTVRINKITIVSYNYPLLMIRVVCGKGTYIRSLARDIGAVLGTGGYLTGLVRTRVGKYSIDQAMNIDQFENI
jgi:tRNA pseudouridine55 synthase